MIAWAMLSGSLAAALLGLVAAVPASAEELAPYLRATLGYDWSEDTAFHDADCTSGPPQAALYGCGNGEDGLPLGIYGDFGSTTFFELGLGVHAMPGVRVEGAVGYRPDLALDGNANFIASGPSQPATADLSQLSLMGFLYLDLFDLMGVQSRFQPFVGAGMGAARNRIGETMVDLPFLDGAFEEYRVVPGGTNWAFAWSIAAGVGFELTDRTTLELAYRYNHLGDVETSPGALFAQFDSGSTTEIGIGGTEASLATHAVTLSLRYDF